MKLSANDALANVDRYTIMPHNVIYVLEINRYRAQKKRHATRTAANGTFLKNHEHTEKTLHVQLNLRKKVNKKQS